MLAVLTWYNFVFFPHQNIFLIFVLNIKEGKKNVQNTFQTWHFHSWWWWQTDLTSCKYPVGSSLESSLLAQTDVHWQWVGSSRFDVLIGRKTVVFFFSLRGSPCWGLRLITGASGGCTWQHFCCVNSDVGTVKPPLNVYVTGCLVAFATRLSSQWNKNLFMW